MYNKIEQNQGDRFWLWRQSVRQTNYLLCDEEFHSSQRQGKSKNSKKIKMLKYSGSVRQCVLTFRYRMCELYAHLKRWHITWVFDTKSDQLTSRVCLRRSIAEKIARMLRCCRFDILHFTIITNSHWINLYIFCSLRPVENNFIFCQQYEVNVEMHKRHRQQSVLFDTVRCNIIFSFQNFTFYFNFFLFSANRHIFVVSSVCWT